MPMLNPAPVKNKSKTCRSCDRPKYLKRSNVDCYWHWLDRQPPAWQDEECVRRKQTVQEHEEAGTPCTWCGWSVPEFYRPRSKTSRMCAGCLSLRKYASHVVITYGLSEEDFLDMYRLQRGRCAVCRHVQRAKRLAVDHDHETNEVRGLLCQSCNEDVLGALGGFSRVVLPKALALVAYVSTPPRSGEWIRPENAHPGLWSARLPVQKTVSERVLGVPLGDDSEPAPF